jgi:prepilin-type N-terminal cleavage/methylation domain-containing protein
MASKSRLFLRPSKAFTLIELLVVIAVIGLLATLSVIALSNARAKSRDSKRLADVKQLQTSLDMYYNEAGHYPSASEFNSGSISFYSTNIGTTTYMKIVPTAPMPNDGPCSNSGNTYYYAPTSDGSSYTLSFCIGGPSNNLAAGLKCATPGGIVDNSCAGGDTGGSSGGGASPSSIAGVSIIDGGAGYTSVPTIIFDGGGGTGAAATAIIDSGSGKVIGIDITNVGSGYTSAPTISFEGGGAATQATATVVLAGESGGISCASNSDCTYPLTCGGGLVAGKCGRFNIVHVATVNDSSTFSDPASVYVVGNYAYVTSKYSNTLEVVDISNPASPILRGRISNDQGGAALAGAQSVYVVGNYAYVASYDSNALEIVDVSNPAAPVHKGKLLAGQQPRNGDGGASLLGVQTVFVSGNYAYVTSWTSRTLEIVDISNPAAPVHESYVSTNSGPWGLYVVGGFAYVGDWGNDSFEIIDVSNPLAAHRTGSIATGDQPKNGDGGAALHQSQNLTVSGHYAYVASNGSNALEVIDISSSTHPTHAGKLTMGDAGSPALNQPTAVSVLGNYAYVTSYMSGALEVVNITDPSAPAHVFTVHNNYHDATLFAPESIFISGTNAYITGYSNTLEILTLANPAAPDHLGKITSTVPGVTMNTPASIAVAGNYAYVVSQGNSSLEILDVTDSAHPIHKGKIKSGDNGAMLDYITGVYVSGSYAYVVGYNGLQIINVSDPANPVPAGTVLSTVDSSLAFSQFVHVAGNYAYITSQGTNSSENALIVIDVTDKANPHLVGKITNLQDSLLNNPFGLQVAGNYAYVACYGSQAIDVIDISNKTNPQHVASVANGVGGAVLTAPQNIRISGNYAYVINGSGYYLEIIDISNPLSPVHKGKFTNSILYGTSDVAVVGNYAYVVNSNSDAGLEIVDVTDPGNPVHKASLSNSSTSGASLVFPDAVLISGNYVYVLNAGGHSLEILTMYTSN